jgi:uncharacterized repeat protein (TIGR01451 family)
MNTHHLLRKTPLFLCSLIALLVGMTAAYTPAAATAAPASLSLEFTGGAGGILNTGFTTFLPGTERQDGNLLLNASGAGTLQIHSTSGDLSSPITQTNALAIQYNSVDAYTIGARLRTPLPFTALFQSGGLYIGKSQNAYIRFTAGFGSTHTSGERLQLEVLDNGKLRTNTLSLPAGTLASIRSSLDLFVTIDHVNGRITALYRIDSDDPAQATQAASRNLPRWLRIQGSTTSIPVYAGILTTNRGAIPSDIVFDWFRLTSPVVASVTGFKSVDKDGISGPPVRPGDTLTYSISVTNNGTASNLQVVDPIPVDTTYVLGSASANAGTVTFANNQLTWTGSVATNATVTISFQIKINQSPLQSSTILNDATLTNTSLGGLPTTLSASTFVSGTRPDLSSSSYIASPGMVGPSDMISYTLTLLNSGSDVAVNATAQLTIPVGLTLVPGSATATSGTISQVGSHLVWTASSSLAIDGTVTIAFRGLVGNTFANNEVIASQATFTCDGTLPNTLTAASIFVQPTASPTPTNPPTATDTPIPTATDTPIPTATATDTPIPTTTATPIPTATATDTAVPTATATPIPTATDTAVPTATDTLIPTATATPLPSDIPTSTVILTNTPTSTSLPTNTPTQSPNATSQPATPPPAYPSRLTIYLPVVRG